MTGVRKSSLLFFLGTDEMNVAFWTDEKLRVLTPQIVSQVPVCASFSVKRVGEDKNAYWQTLKHALQSLTGAVSSSEDLTLKSLNLSLCMHTRSSELQVRLLALQCVRGIWEVEGGKLIGYASETATFIAEMAEDENDEVVREAGKLKRVVEGVAGKLEV